MKKFLTHLGVQRWLGARLHASLRTRQGFTLLELIISFGVMSIVVFGATSLYVTSIRANAAQIERFIAYSLAQEGLEGVRNIRDTYFRQSLAWDGSDTSVSLVDKPFIDGTYIISRKVSLPVIQSFLAENKDSVKSSVPWVFKSLSQKDEAMIYKIHSGENSGIPHYVNKIEPMPADAAPTIYRRSITLSALDKNRILVTSHVEWLDHGTPKSLDLTTELTNWKQRPF